MTDKNIVLIGFMGTGKSTVGKILAKRMNRTWIDIDQRIEEQQKRKISEIFEKDGEAAFRAMEKAMVREVAIGRSLVITTGGGAVVDEENLRHLKNSGLLIALTAAPETIYQRVKKTTHRPMLKSGDLMTEIKTLLGKRAPFYAKADMTFTTDKKTATQVAIEILGVLQKDEEFEFGKDWF